MEVGREGTHTSELKIYRKSTLPENSRVTFGECVHTADHPSVSRCRCVFVLSETRPLWDMSIQVTPPFISPVCVCSCACAH